MNIGKGKKINTPCFKNDSFFASLVYKVSLIDDERRKTFGLFFLSFDKIKVTFIS